MKIQRTLFLPLLALSMGWSAIAQAQSGLANTTVLIIRHGEKPETGTGLTPVGEARAKAYVPYFQHYKVDGRPFHVDYVFATKDGKNSARERLTVAPLSEALKLTTDLRFKNKEVQELADAMRAKHYGNDILICWHHGQIPNLINALGGDSKKLIRADKWPADHFDWVIQMSFDREGHLSKSKRVEENLKLPS